MKEERKERKTKRRKEGRKEETYRPLTPTITEMRKLLMRVTVAWYLSSSIGPGVFSYHLKGQTFTHRS